MGRLKSNSRVCDGTLSGEIAINGRVVLASHGHTGHSDVWDYRATMRDLNDL